MGVCSADQECFLARAKIDSNFLVSTDDPNSDADISLKTLGISDRSYTLTCATGYYNTDYSEDTPLTLTCELQNDDETSGKNNLDDIECDRASLVHLYCLSNCLFAYVLNPLAVLILQSKPAR